MAVQLVLAIALAALITLCILITFIALDDLIALISLYDLIAFISLDGLIALYVSAMLLSFQHFLVEKISNCILNYAVAGFTTYD